MATFIIDNNTHFHKTIDIVISVKTKHRKLLR